MLLLNNKHSQLSNWFAISLISIWLTGTAYGFWWFQFKDMRGFSDTNWEEKAVKFQGRFLSEYLTKELGMNLLENKVTVVNFINPLCECNKFNYAHVDELKKKFGLNVNFISLLSKRANMRNVDELVIDHQLNIYQVKEMPSDVIPASPAAAVFDKAGQLVYFGPFSDGAVCGQGNNLVESRLTKLNNNEKLEKWINTRGYGCFCDW